MTEQPYPAPQGKKWIQGWFGEWTLVPDPDQPPPGYRFKINFWTAKKELAPLFGPGVDGVANDPNVAKRPAPAINTGAQNFGTPSSPVLAPLVPVRESGLGVDGLKGDPNPDPRLRKSTPGRYTQE